MTEKEDFREALTRYTKETEKILDAYTEDVQGPDGALLTTLVAMRYALNGGGKRLRPLLMRLSFELFQGDNAALLYPFMAAIEMIHTYSLIHDDLPAMDNDDMRRGRKTAHVVYGEAQAVLAGDGLLNLSYETALRATEDCRDEAEMLRVVLAVRILAQKAGIRGMIGGQCVDIVTEKKAPEHPAGTLSFIHENKTAALFEAALMCGAILADAPEEAIDRMEQAGSALGHCFQIRDDVLDETGDATKLGKSTGKDRASGKLTWTSLYGTEQAVSDTAAFLEQTKQLVRSCGAEEDSFFMTLLDALVARES